MTEIDTWKSAVRTRGGAAAGTSAAALALMWVLEGLDTVTHHSLDSLGLSSWDFGDLWSLVTAPFIHFGFAHLAANSLPFLVLGFVIALVGVGRWALVTAITALASGLAAFFVNTPHVNTAGASGVVFGYVTYLISRGIFSRRWSQIAVGAIVLAVYGYVLWGVLPGTAGVSWQGHLGGALGGVGAAWRLDRHDRAREVPVI